jgi:hypothetical protein
MDVLKIVAKLKALKWKLYKYGKIEDNQAQEVNMVCFIYSWIKVCRTIKRDSILA